jgi:hypothetical protein
LDLGIASRYAGNQSDYTRRSYTSLASSGQLTGRRARDVNCSCCQGCITAAATVLHARAARQKIVTLKSKRPHTRLRLRHGCLGYLLEGVEIRRRITCIARFSPAASMHITTNRMSGVIEDRFAVAFSPQISAPDSRSHMPHAANEHLNIMPDSGVTFVFAA